MTKNDAAQYLPFVQALASGKVIQVNTGYKDAPFWADLEIVNFDVLPELYRVKQDSDEPIGWLVLDADGAPQFVANSKQAAHDHINDCLQGGYPEAATFVVRPAYAHAA